MVVINEKFLYENIRHLAPVLAHEALHRDPAVTNKEELIAASIQALIYGQFVLETPSVATSGTHLARSSNTQLMGRLNTRDANGKLRLFTSTTGPCPDACGIFPGGTFVPYFAAPYEPLGSDTPGNAVLKAMVRKVVGPSVALPATVNFNNQTALLLDSRQVVFTPTKLVRLATILKLDTSGSTTTQQRAQEATGAEQPVPGWREIYGAE